MDRIVLYARRELADTRFPEPGQGRFHRKRQRLSEDKLSYNLSPQVAPAKLQTRKKI